MLCPCPCGQSDLADEPSHGLMTLADVAAEYRTCSSCKSTRPFMHPFAIEGQKVVLFHDPLSTEPLGEWDDLFEAMWEAPPADVAELRREGIVLARAMIGVDAVLGWMALPPTR